MKIVQKEVIETDNNHTRTSLDCSNKNAWIDTEEDSAQLSSSNAAVTRQRKEQMPSEQRVDVEEISVQKIYCK